MEKIITFHIHTELGECIVTNFNDGLKWLGLDQHQIEVEDKESGLTDLGGGLLKEFKVQVKRVMTQEEVSDLPEFEF